MSAKSSPLILPLNLGDLAQTTRTLLEQRGINGRPPVREFVAALTFTINQSGVRPYVTEEEAIRAFGLALALHEDRRWRSSEVPAWSQMHDESRLNEIGDAVRLVRGAAKAGLL